MEILKEKIKELRIEKGLSQTALAKNIGFSQNAISQWESGKRVPDAIAVKALAKFFGVSADYLLGLEN
ncbi:MAG: helix-turn-helix transcriptional regulator [Clostridia bacterium]|nr:helix-turn-helix transcriptional regulator [Clostridia bacterium]